MASDLRRALAAVSLVALFGPASARVEAAKDPQKANWLVGAGLLATEPRPGWVTTVAYHQPASRWQAVAAVAGYSKAKRSVTFADDGSAISKNETSADVLSVSVGGDFRYPFEHIVDVPFRGYLKAGGGLRVDHMSLREGVQTEGRALGGGPTKLEDNLREIVVVAPYLSVGVGKLIGKWLELAATAACSSDDSRHGYEGLKAARLHAMLTLAARF